MEQPIEDIIIYHNNRCGKSRAALALLRGAGAQPRIRYYLEQPPSPEELKELLIKLGIKAEELVRKKELLYLENYQGKSLSEDSWIRVLSENPVLLERPIAVRGDTAVVGRPPEKVLELTGRAPEKRKGAV